MAWETTSFCADGVCTPSHATIGDASATIDWARGHTTRQIRTAPEKDNSPLRPVRGKHIETRRIMLSIVLKYLDKRSPGMCWIIGEIKAEECLADLYLTTQTMSRVGSRGFFFLLCVRTVYLVCMCVYNEGASPTSLVCCVGNTSE